MDYNTQRTKLLLPEYGRNIQTMVDRLATIEDRDERTRAAKTIVSVMGNLYPQLRDLPDFRHKLWNHLAIMAGFNLDIDAPYPLPSEENFMQKPEKIEYCHHRIKCRHYGLMTEQLLQQIKNIEDEELKQLLLVLTANHMKKSFLSWNKDSVEDEQIYDDIQNLYGEKIDIPEGLTLVPARDLVYHREFAQKKGGKAPNATPNNASGKQQGKNGAKRNYYKKQYPS